MHYAWQIKKLLANSNCRERGRDIEREREKEKREREGSGIKRERRERERERGRLADWQSLPSSEFCLANSTRLVHSHLPLPPSLPACSYNVQCTLTVSFGIARGGEAGEAEGGGRNGWTGDSKIWSNQMNNAQVALSKNTHNNAISNKRARERVGDCARVREWERASGCGCGCGVGVAD